MMMRKQIHSNSAVIAILVSVLSFYSMELYATPEQVQKLIAEGELATALVSTDEDLAKDPDNITYLFLKGLILTKQEKLEQARDIFLQLTQLNPELPEPYNNLAVIYAALGDFDSAREALQNAINTHPSYATAHENMGDIYAKLASKAYNQALELDKDNSTAKAKLSLVNDLFSNPYAGRDSIPVVAANDKQVTEQPDQSVTAVSESVVEVEAELPVVSRQEQSQEVVAVVSQLSSRENSISVSKQETDELDRQKLQMQLTIDVVKRRILAWAEAWSGQDVNQYLSYYARDFTPPSRQTIDQWRTTREIRITKPGVIQVAISDIVVGLLGPAHAQATFTQMYDSDTYSDRVKKTLLMKKEGNQWLITQEGTN